MGVLVSIETPPPAAGTIVLSASTYSVVETAGTLTVVVNRTGGSDGIVSIDHATSNGTATAGSDYTDTSGTLTFQSGDTQKTYTIPILTGGGAGEGDETFTVTLTNVLGGATLGSPSASTVTITEESTGTIKTTFPKIAAYLTSSPHDYQLLEADIGKLDVCILSHYPSWESVKNKTVAANLAAIKAVNANILLLHYSLVAEIHDTAGDHQAIRDKLEAEDGPPCPAGANTPDWWLRNSAGNKLPAFSGTSQTNFSTYTCADAGGQRFPQWLADDDWDRAMKMDSNWDGFFIDVVRPEPFHDPGDWNGNGSNDANSGTVASEAFRNGTVAFKDALKTNISGAFVGANGTSWGNDNDPPNDAPEYFGQFDGSLTEYVFGKSWSWEGSYWNNSFTLVTNAFGTWNKARDIFIKNTSQITRSDPLNIFEVQSYLPPDISVANAYKYFRYAFATCLCISDAFFDFVDKANSRQAVPFFDEYDLDGSSTTAWLGSAVDAKRATPQESGVYWREFDNGIAVINPRQNGSQTVTIPAAGASKKWQRINGTQDSTINDGTDQAVSLTISEADGLILRRVAS